METIRRNINILTDKKISKLNSSPIKNFVDEYVIKADLVMELKSEIADLAIKSNVQKSPELKSVTNKVCNEIINTKIWYN